MHTYARGEWDRVRERERKGVCLCMGVCVTVC